MKKRITPAEAVSSTPAIDAELLRLQKAVLDGLEARAAQMVHSMLTTSPSDRWEPVANPFRVGSARQRLTKDADRVHIVGDERANR